MRGGSTLGQVSTAGGSAKSVTPITLVVKWRKAIRWSMSRLIDDLSEVIVARLLRDYYQEVQECIGLMMCEELTVDEFEDALDNLDFVYAIQILRSLQ